MNHVPSTINIVSFYVLWLTIIGCFAVAVPLAGLLTLAAGIAVTAKRPGR